MIKTNNIHLFITTAFVFIILNTLENIIHFSIGRNIQNKDTINRLNIEIPTKADFIKIIYVMIIFAILQGLFTCYMENCFKF